MRDPSSATRPGAKIKARTPEEFERWRRLAEKLAEKRLRSFAGNNDTRGPTPTGSLEVKK
jgi:hypothetical protein